MRIPNVVCFPLTTNAEEPANQPDGTFLFRVPLRFGSLNLRKHNAHYLSVWYKEQNGVVRLTRIYHIKAVFDEPADFRLQLDHSYVPARVLAMPFRTNQDAQYHPLYEFGMQELQPGVLVRIAAPPFSDQSTDSAIGDTAGIIDERIAV